MAIYKKIMLGLLFAVFGLSMPAAAREDVRDESGRTELMNYVRDRENLLVRYKKMGQGALDGVCHNIWMWKSQTETEISCMMNSSSDFYAKDHNGKTVLNYCGTPEMYNILRAQGAPFQFDAWFHVYRSQLALASLAVAGTAVILNQEGVLTADTISAFAQDTCSAGVILAANVQESFESVDAVEICQHVVDAAIDTAVGFSFLSLLWTFLNC